VLPLRALIDARPTSRGWLAWWRGRTTLDLIVPGLWMGGFPRPGGAVLRTLEEVRVGHVVTTTFERPHLPKGMTTRWIPFLDLDLPLHMDPLFRAGRDIAERVRSGEQVFVHCGHGYDRSGLVVALALRELRPACEGIEILDVIRAGRGSEALHNRRFARYVLSLPPLELDPRGRRADPPRPFLGRSALEPVRPL
jgi:protein-tyrosine phosphatase